MNASNFIHSSPSCGAFPSGTHFYRFQSLVFGMASKARRALFAGVTLVCAAWGWQTQAANFTTTVQQAAGANWNGTIWQPGGVAPTAGNTYQCVAGGNPTRLRNPAAAGVQTFVGN